MALASNACNDDAQTSHIFVVHIWLIKVTHNTTERFTCQVERKSPPKVNLKENEKLLAIGMLELGNLRTQLLVTLATEYKCNFATCVAISTYGLGQGGSLNV